MNNDIRTLEALSALVDGECDELEVARVLKQLRHQPELRRQWQSMHVTRGLLRQESISRLSVDFAERVQMAMDQDDDARPARANDISLNETLPDTTKPKWLTGLALAASVTAVTVLGLHQFRSLSLLNVDQGVAGSSAASLAYAQVTAGTRWHLQQAELEDRLNNYLLSHMEYAPSGELQGMLPYSRLAAYDLNQ